jgi:hypothetical protein
LDAPLLPEGTQAMAMDSDADNSIYERTEAIIELPKKPGEHNYLLGLIMIAF